jgi:hypothetical protein
LEASFKRGQGSTSGCRAIEEEEEYLRVSVVDGKTNDSELHDSSHSPNLICSQFLVNAIVICYRTPKYVRFTISSKDALNIFKL